VVGRGLSSESLSLEMVEEVLVLELVEMPDAALEAEVLQEGFVLALDRQRPSYQ